MIERELLIENRLGLHARATAKLVQLLSGFNCDATLSAKGRQVNAKSIMGVMMLAAAKGSTVTVETDGDDEVEAIEALARLISTGFGEAS